MRVKSTCEIVGRALVSPYKADDSIERANAIPGKGEREQGPLHPQLPPHVRAAQILLEHFDLNLPVELDSRLCCHFFSLILV